MSETPTARELLDELDRKHWHPGPIKDLAARVEKVLFELAAAGPSGYVDAARIKRILDGGKS